MPAIRMTKLIQEYTPVVVDPNHMGLSIGQVMDNMIHAAIRNGECIHEVALAFEDSADFYMFREQMETDPRFRADDASRKRKLAD